MRKNITLATAVPLALMIGLAACGQNQNPAQEPNSSESAAAETSIAALSLDEAWVKAADDGMTAVFGTLKNDTDTDITLVEAKYPDADMVQLHETVEDDSGATTMREKKGGIAIPAGESVTLEPGGDHIMLMGLKKPIKAGEEISVELVTADDRSVDVTAVAKEYSGAKENYSPEEAEGTADDKGEDHDDMSHDDMDHDDADHEDMDHGDH